MMTKTCVAACLSVLLGGLPALSVSSEFRDSDVLPEIGQIAFTRDAVGFVSRPKQFLGGRDSVLRFVYDRGSRTLAEVDAAQFRARFQASALVDGPRSKQHELTGRTSGGVEYQSKVKLCGEGDEDEVRGLTVGGKAIPILARDECTSVSSVEIVGGDLWLGTAYSGESGYSKAEGIIVESPDGKRARAQIGLPGWVVQVRADPSSEEVWAVTEYGIYRIGRQFRILSAHLYYHDFDPLTGEPRLLFSATAMPGNPLAVVSRMLPAQDRKSFYEVTRGIPKADLEKFRLYDFFMCCDFNRSYPASFQPLLPFFVKASVQADPWLRNLWWQAACSAGGPEGAQYCRRSY